MNDDIVYSNISSIKRQENTAVITISNQLKNFITIPEFIECSVLENWLDSHKDINSLIITGEGKNFSYGADTSIFSSMNDKSEISAMLEKGKKLLEFIENLPLVTAAAINGGCFGGGLETALSCQFRICSYKAFIGMPEVTRGVIPGMGGIERLTRLIGKSKTIEMCLSGEIITADEAFKRGIADRVSKNADCFSYTMGFVNELTADKSIEQIKSVISIANNTVNGEKDLSGSSFADILINSVKRD